MNLSSRSVIHGNTIITLTNPRLINIESRRVINLDPLSILCLDLHNRELGALLLDWTKTHTASNNCLVSGVLQVCLDVSCSLLLGEAHLNNGLLDGLAGNLVGEWEELLDGSIEVVRFAVQNTLGLLQDLLLVQTAALGDVSDDHLAFPAHTGHWRWIKCGGHGVWISLLWCSVATLELLAGDGLILEDGGGRKGTADKSWVLWLALQVLLREVVVLLVGGLDLLDILALGPEPVEECARLGVCDGCGRGGC